MNNERDKLASTSDPEPVLQVSHALLRAVNDSSLAGVMAVWSDDGLLMPPHHPTVRGRESITEYFRQLFSRGRLAFQFTTSTVEIVGGMAIERVEYAASFFPTGGGDPSHDRGKGVHVFQQHSNGHWQLVMDIWNSDQPLPLPASNKSSDV